MSFKQISSPDPKYLAASDILIGDMSDINYEFLLYNRPVILLANEWLRENFPDIGIKTDLESLADAIKRSLDQPDEFNKNRMHWLERTINFPENKTASKHILDLAIENSEYKNPKIYLVYGGNSVRKTNLQALYEERDKANLDIEFIHSAENNGYAEKIYIAAHFGDLDISDGYKVHLDHGLKGLGTTQLEMSINEYKANNHFPKIDLHITAGKEGYLRTTKYLLGPYHERAVIGGYPKADLLLKCNTEQNRNEVCQELGFDPDLPIVIYAPAGNLCYAKPGGSLNYNVIKTLKKIQTNLCINVLVKFKNKKHHPLLIPLKKVKAFLNREPVEAKTIA